MKTSSRSSGFWALTAASAALLSTACGSPLDRFEQQRVQRAPSSHQETGWLVSGATQHEIAQVLKENPGAQFRELSTNHAIYEVFGLSSAPDHSHFKSALVEKNQWFPMNHLKGPLVRESRIQALAARGLSDSNEDLSRCAENPVNAPIAFVQVVAPSPKEGESKVSADGEKVIQVQRGELVHLTSLGSKTHPEVDGSIRTAWVVLSPAGAMAEEERVFLGSELKLKTETMGLYSIGLIVQDKNSACSLGRLDVAVTGNAPYLGQGVVDPSIQGKLAKIKMYQRTLTQANEAEALSRGSKLTIAVIDSGVNYNHPALRNNIFTFKAEIPDNKIDDDGNGITDDVVGYDFHNGDTSPFDDVGHGSHVSGLAVSELFGMAKDAKVLPIKALGILGGDVGSITAAILYAVDSGAKIINMSLGSYGFPTNILLKAVHYAEVNDVLIVAASGNGHPMTGMGLDTDSIPNMPSALSNENILAVAAHGSSGNLASYSNYGRNTVDIVAPGGGGENDGLVSTYMENERGGLFIEMSGTSMAAPVAAGVAAQVWSLRPDLRAYEVRRVLMKSGREAPELKPFIASGRHLNALDAVRLAKTYPPSRRAIAKK